MRDVIGQWTVGAWKRKPAESIETPNTVTVEASRRPASEAIYEATDDAIYEETDIDYEHLGRRSTSPGSGTYQGLVKDKAVRGAAAPDYRAHRKHK